MFWRRGRCPPFLPAYVRIENSIHTHTHTYTYTYTHTIHPKPSLVNNHFVLTPTNHLLQVKDRLCLVFAEI